MPRRAIIELVSLHSSLVNLPISLYGPLLERSIRPQNLGILLTRVSDNAQAYIGWTGMPSASSLQHFNSSSQFETIEIDPQYASALGFVKGDLVEIGLLHDLPLAKSVATEPLTSDDWEIIEIHASLVESTLLSQVRVAKIGQEIDVWVLGRTRVRLRVLSLDPKSSALLLTTNTEVTIAPKLHPSSASTAARPTPTKSPSKPPAQTLRIIPARVVKTTPKNTLRDGTVLAYVSRSTFATLTKSTLASLRPPSDPTTITYHKCILRRFRPPSDPSDTSAQAPAPPAPVPHVFHPGDSDRQKEPTKEPVDELYVAWRPNVPNYQVILEGGFPSVDGAEEWDIVGLSTTEGAPLTLSQEPEENSTHTSSSHDAPTLAGVDAILTRCFNFCLQKFVVHGSAEAVYGVPGLLITGRSGAGKTSIVRAVAKSLQEDSRTYTYTHYVDMARYAEKPVPALKALFRYWLDKATWHRPAILIFDNLDKLLCAEVEHADSFRARHLTEIFLSLYSSAARFAAPNARGLLILATAASPADLHPLLRTAHVFEEIVTVMPPNKNARRDILAQTVQQRLARVPHVRQEDTSPLNYSALATQTEGYSATDLHDLVARALHQVAMRAARDDVQTVLLTTADFDAALVDFVPLSLRDVGLQKSEVVWSDIGGLRGPKRVLRETLEWPTKYAAIFSQSPLRLRSGLLLYGYPGCGKTLLASAVARECGLHFIGVKGPELLNKYIGASEKAVRSLFERASSAKPCVLFFDEFESIAPKRGHDSTGVTDRVVNQLLTQMDGAEGLDGVYVLAATSRPDLIDGALLRPGRLDKAVLCDMPDTEERAEIIRAVTRKVTLAPSIDIEALARATAGYSGADLQALVYNAHLEVVHASIDAPAGKGRAEQSAPRIEYTVLGGEKRVVSRAEEVAFERRLLQIQTGARANARGGDGAAAVAPAVALGKREITQEHVQRVLAGMRPSVSPEERARLDRIYREFVSDRSGPAPMKPEDGVGVRTTLM